MAKRRASPSPEARTMPEQSLKEALLPYLNLARRGGMLEIGFRATRRSLHRGRCMLLLLATDAGDSLMKMEFGEVPMLRVTDRITLGGWLGRKEISILGITDPHLAETLLKKVEGSDPGPVPGR